jgi:hypothetical protein
MTALIANDTEAKTKILVAISKAIVGPILRQSDNKLIFHNIFFDQPSSWDAQSQFNAACPAEFAGFYLVPRPNLPHRFPSSERERV